jgi:lysophospholipase L1-like esterase
MSQHHPWSRYVAIGDSFTEGIGDPEPQSPGGHRGWADRIAEVLSAHTDGFTYANLAIRGRLMQQIATEQVDAALALKPDLISVSAGGNDIIRPGSDADEVAARFEKMIERLSADGATVIMFNGPDIGKTPVMRWRDARASDIEWAREYLVPWVLRRVRHQSSGDNVVPKRPSF